MEESKRKKIEDKLRQMIEHENHPNKGSRIIKAKHNPARVIRRRKGAPDMRIV